MREAIILDRVDGEKNGHAYTIVDQMTINRHFWKKSKTRLISRKVSTNENLQYTAFRCTSFVDTGGTWLTIQWTPTIIFRHLHLFAKNARSFLVTNALVALLCRYALTMFTARVRIACSGSIELERWSSSAVCKPLLGLLTQFAALTQSTASGMSNEDHCHRHNSLRHSNKLHWHIECRSKARLRARRNRRARIQDEADCTHHIDSESRRTTVDRSIEHCFEWPHSRHYSGKD